MTTIPDPDYPKLLQLAQEEVVRVQAENARLRAALEHILRELNAGPEARPCNMAILDAELALAPASPPPPEPKP